MLCQMCDKSNVKDENTTLDLNINMVQLKGWLSLKTGLKCGNFNENEKNYFLLNIKTYLLKVKLKT